MYRISFILLLFILSSCNRQQVTTSQYHESTAATHTLSGSEIPIAIELLMPNKITIIDNQLIIYDQSGEKQFHVFKLPEVEYNYSFGGKGQGPDEFANIDPLSIKELNGNLAFLDNNKIVKMEIGKDDAKIIKTHPIVMGKNPINRLNLINDSTYISDMLEGDYEHHKNNLITGKELIKFGEYPKEAASIRNDIDRYQSYKKANTNYQDKLAVFYLYHDRMKIYQNETLKIQSLGKNDKQHTEGNNPIIYRAEPMATNDYIYTLFIGKRKNEINFTSFSPQLEIWDWQGQLKSKYLLDKPIITFFVSEKLKKIYATSIEDTNQIYVFDLPDASVQQEQSAYKTIENDFYSVEIPEGLTYATASPEEEKNNITEHNGQYYNSCYFVVDRNSGTASPFKGSIAIAVSHPIDQEQIPLRDFVHNRYAEIMQHAIYYDTTSRSINNKETLIHKSITQHTDPKGKIDTLTSQNWIWKDGEKTIEISYRSIEDFDNTINQIDQVVKSFVLKH